MTSPEPRKLRTLDVRPLLARGEEPLTKILETVAALKPNENLLLISPFLPSPLVERLASEGFTAHPERASDGSWRTRFLREDRAR